MDDNLKNRTILIGKEPGSGDRLFLSVVIDGKSKTGAIGERGSVPHCVSRLKANENVAHCKIDIDANGMMKLTNLKEQNVTYVNGAEIETKRIDEGSYVELGIDKYRIDIKEVLDAALKLVFAGGGAVFALDPLKKVWHEYKDESTRLKERTRKLGILASVPMVFSMSAGLASAFVPSEYRTYTLMLTGVALVIMLIGLYLRATDKSTKKLDELNEKFQSIYVCPNPKCNRFMGNQSYKLLVQQYEDGSCPKCKCKYIVKNN